MAETVYDVIIVGGGPAGLGAALYTARDRLKTLIIEKLMPGGQINNTNRIENYPGFAEIDGPGLIERMQKQVESFEAEIKSLAEVTGLEKRADGNIAIHCGDTAYVGKAVILAPGSNYRKLGVPGETEFRDAGAGVSYCGTCDAPFFRDREVVSVGGGNTAIEEALHLAKYASKVTVIHRRDEFRADKILAEELVAKANEPNSNLIIKYDTVATAIEGDGKVQSAKLKNVNGTEYRVPQGFRGTDRARIYQVRFRVSAHERAGCVRRRRLPHRCVDATRHRGRRRGQRGLDAQAVFPRSSLVEYPNR